MNIAFFGTPEFSTFVLDELIKGGFMPTVVVTTPDKPAGRGLALTQSPVKKYALEHGIEVLQPEKLRDEFITELKERDIDLIIVAAYGKILPAAVLNIGNYPPLNVHPSLLPKYRGTSPVESQILAGEKDIGVTIIQMDELMDHGPIIAQEAVPVSDTPTREELNAVLWRKGGSLLVQILPEWFARTITGTTQDESQATFCSKMTKEDGEVSLSDDPIILDRKYRAYQPWPGLFFFAERDGKKIRVKIKSAHFDNGHFVIDTVIPENGKPMSFDAFQKQYA